MVKKILRYSISFVLYYSGLVGLSRAMQKRQRRWRILVYHRVNDALEGSSPALPVERFRQHMRYLKRHYAPVKLGEGVRRLKEAGTLSAGAASVTFDDGYKDILKNAFPIAKEMGIPMTIFLSSGCIGDDKVLWFDSVYQIFKERKRLDEFYGFRERLKMCKDEDRIQALRDLGMPLHSGLMLNWEEVRSLSRDDLIEIGAHSRTHTVLTRTDTDTAWNEIDASRADIGGAIDKLVGGFSYPAGEYDELIKELVRKSGFAYACTVDGKFVTRRSDIYALSRITVVNCPVFVFATELCGILSGLRNLARQVRP